MSPGKRSGGPGHHPEAAATSRTTAATNKPDDRGQATAAAAVLMAFAVKYLAVGGATYDWIVVRACPLCGHAHKHILFEGDRAGTIERAPACARHRTYAVTITDVVPAVQQHRQRGAA